jgi:hypothetical protein
MTDVGVVIISGIPGVGKTTVARMLAARFPRAAHIEGDALSFDAIVSGQPSPMEPIAWQELLRLRRCNIALLADQFVRYGYVACCDDVVVAPEVLDFYIKSIESRPLRLVELIPDIDVVQQRDSSRDKQVFEYWKHLDAELRANMPRVGLWIDTSFLEPDATVRAILERFDSAIVA